MYSVNVYYLAILSLCFYGTGSYGQEFCSSCQCPYLTGETLDCSGRGITNITECEPLDGCLNATTLNFSSNAITEVTLDFNEAGLLTSNDCHLDFSRNAIAKSLLSLTHRSCESLTLDFSFNAFINITASSFGYYFYSESLNSVTLNISQNQIMFIESIRLPYSIFSDIGNVTIDLSFNEIKHGDFKIYTPSYIRRGYVLLSDNNITHFRINDFLRNQYNIRATFIVLSNNYISGFTEDDLSTDQFYSDIRLDLSGNRWNCNCSQRTISDGNSSLRSILMKEESVQPVCADPPSVRGRLILSLSEEEFVCSPEVDTAASSQQEAFRGDTVEILCPFFGGDPQVERVDWEFTPGDSLESGEPSSFRSTYVHCPLIIMNVQKVHEGEYKCTVSNGESLTIIQTLRVVGDDATEREGSMGSPTAGQTGLVAVVIVFVILWILTTVSLIIIGYKFHQLSLEGVKTNTKVAFRYRSKPPNVPQSAVKSSEQGNAGYDHDDEEEYESYEIPSAVGQTLPPTNEEEEDLYEVRDRYVNA